MTNVIEHSIGKMPAAELLATSDESMSATYRLLRQMMTSTDTLKMLNDPVHQSIISKMAAARPSAVSQQLTRRNSARRVINLRHKSISADGGQPNTSAGSSAAGKSKTSASLISHRTAPSSLPMATASASPRVSGAASSNTDHAHLLAARKAISNEEFINYRHNLMKLKYMRAYETKLMNIFQDHPSRLTAMPPKESLKHTDGSDATLQHSESATGDQQQHRSASFCHESRYVIERASKSSGVRMTGIQHYDRILNMLRASRNYQMAQAREQELTAAKRFLRRHRQPTEGSIVLSAREASKQQAVQHQQRQDEQEQQQDQKDEEEEQQQLADKEDATAVVTAPPNTSRSGRQTAAAVPTTSIVIYLPDANTATPSSAAATGVQDNKKPVRRSYPNREQRTGPLVPARSTDKLPAIAGANRGKNVREDDCYKISYSIARDSLLAKRHNLVVSGARKVVPVVFIGQQTPGRIVKPIHVNY